MKKNKTNKKVKFSASNSQRIDVKWVIKTLILTFVLSAVFNLFSTAVMDRASIFVAVLILLFIISVGIIFDLIGTAITTAEETAFHSMAAKKIKGAKAAIRLVRAKDKAANFCNDIVGDICGIVSGSAAAAVIAFLNRGTKGIMVLICSLGITGLVAALTVSGKALCKTVAIKYNNRIIYAVAKILAVFGFEKGKK